MVGGTSGRGTTGREGTSDRVEIGLRESGRPGAKEVKAWRVTRRNREVVDFTQYRVKIFSELTNFGN